MYMIAAQAFQIYSFCNIDESVIGQVPLTNDDYIWHRNKRLILARFVITAEGKYMFSSN